MPAPEPITLDPTAADHHGEAARLRAAGPAAPVLLPGDVPAWAIPDPSTLMAIVGHPDVSKDWRNWSELAEGRIPDGWPLIGMIQVDNMVTADGEEHRRLRRLVLEPLSPRNAARMAPRITKIVNALLEELPDHAAPDGSVDVRAHFALEVPLQVICEIMGVPAGWRAELRQLVDNILSATLGPDEVIHTQAAVGALLDRLIDRKTAEPGKDFTSELIALRATDPDALSASELADTLWALLAAGHETTLGLITNATRALLTHPDQLALLQQRRASWEDLVEEILRWDGPVSNFPGRYARKDITIGGVTIPAGAMILTPYSGTGRCPAHNGPDADRFQLNGPPKMRTLAFGWGTHICPGAALARTQARIALSHLFTRYPNLRLAVPESDLTPVESLFTNTLRTLPAYLT